MLFGRFLYIMPGDILVFNPVKKKGSLQQLSSGTICCIQDAHKVVHAGVLVAGALFLNCSYCSD